MVWGGVEGVELPIEEEVEGVGLSLGEGVGSWLSCCIFSFNLFMNVSCDFLPHSCLLGSFVTFSDVLSMFILRYKERGLKQTWIQLLNILFLIQPGKRWKVLQGSLKNHRKPLKTCCTLVSNVGATRYFLSQNRSGLLMREWSYSTSAEVVTINGRTDYETNASRHLPVRVTNHHHHIAHFRVWWQR